MHIGTPGSLAAQSTDAEQSDEVAEDATRLTAANLVLVGVVLVGVALRFWQLGHGHLSVDESYTALAARMPFDRLVHHIDTTDPHPPLSYLLLQPVTSLTTETVWLRFLPALASSLALAVLGWWQRHRGVTGIAAVAVFAASPYQLGYGREMRMYGFVCLAGVVTAWAAERWLQTGRRMWIATAVVAASACAFLHATGVILLVCLIVLPLRRRDRGAWELRAGCVGGLVLFAALWGSHALNWRGGPSSYPSASLSWLSIVVNESIAAVPANRWLVLPLIVIGGVLIVRRRDTSSQVWLLLGALGVTILYLASLRQGVLIPKSVMAYSWAAALALGAVVGALWRRSVVLGVAGLAMLALLVLPYTSRGLNTDESAGGFLDVLEAVVEPGDAVAVTAPQHDIRDTIQWYRSIVPGVTVDMDSASVPELEQVMVAGEARTGRIWLVSSGTAPDIDGLGMCGTVDDLPGDYHVTCLQADR